MNHSLIADLNNVIEAIKALPHDEQIIALDFDNTCVRGDLGECVQSQLVDDLALPLLAEDLSPIGGSAFERDISPYLPLRATDEEARRYIQHIVSTEYLRIMEESGHREGYLYSVRLLAGMSPDEVRNHSLKTFKKDLASPMITEEVPPPPGLNRPGYSRTRGLRIHKEMRELVRKAQDQDIKVLVISASAHCIVAPIAEHYFGVPPENIWGIHTDMKDNGTLAPRCVEPIPYGQGKVASIERVVGQRAAFAAGDARTDLEMLQSTRIGALLLDRGNVALRQEAEDRGWIIHPQESVTCEPPLP